MKKETLVAVVLGVTMGAVIALVLVSSAKKKEIEGNKVMSPSVSPTIFQPTTKGQLLTLIEPKNGLSTTGSSISIKGKAQKNSLIILQSPITEKTLKLEKEDFKVDYSLGYGENIIRVTAYSGNTSEDKILKIYRIAE